MLRVRLPRAVAKSRVRYRFGLAATAAGLAVICVFGSIRATGQAAGRDDPRSLPSEPSPQLSPEEVIGIQVGALSAEGDIETRIENCYRFASPANRAHTGPLDRFQRMVATPSYRPLLSAKKFLVGRAQVKEGEAHLLLTVADSDGKLWVYRCFLSKQTGDGFAGCWMTDAVVLAGVAQPPVPHQKSYPSSI